MNIHEYQAKALFCQYGIRVPEGRLILSVEDVAAAVQELAGPPWVVKAQIHAGGRGKGGGIRVCKSQAEAKLAVAALLGSRLVTPQTGPKGSLVGKIWAEEGINITRELYLAIVLDRGAGRLAVVASSEGGMDIEEVAALSPQRIHTVHLDAHHTLWPFQARQLCHACGLSGKMLHEGAALIQKLVRLCLEKDAILVEINPLVVTRKGELLALDAKLDFDESALPRQPDIAPLADPQEKDALEEKADACGVNYVRVNGYIGTMVNGAGLAMATMDAIKQAGGEPANFLDVGGGASEEMVTKGFELLQSDPNVRGILVNIFGGILRCDVVAAGIVNAVKLLAISVPLVIRMEGTNVKAGRDILAASGISFCSVTDMSEAAEAIVRLTAEGGAQ